MSKFRKTKQWKSIIVCFALMAGFIGCDKDKDKSNDVAVTGVSLDKTTLTLNVGETETLTATIAPADATNKDVMWESEQPAIVTVEDGVVTAVAGGIVTITVVSTESGETATCTVTVIADTPDGEWVEINGVKWATRNVDMPGTFAENPEDAGMFYQWNRKVGWSSTDPMVNSDGGTIWDGSKPDGLVWAKANDPSPAGYRIPTMAELITLCDNNVEFEWTTLNDVNGGLFTDKTTGNSIFLPAAGNRSAYGDLLSVSKFGYYWSCATWSGSWRYMWSLTIGSTCDTYINLGIINSMGYSVRPVAK